MKSNLILLWIYYLLVVLISFFHPFPFLVTILFFLTIPAIILLLSRRSLALTPILFSLIIGIPGTIIIDSIAVISETWATSTMFNSKLFDIVTYEQFLWAISFLLLMSSLYTYKYSNQRCRFEYQKSWFLIFIILALLIPVLSIIYFKIYYVLEIQYVFLLGGITLYLVPIVQLLFTDKVAFLRILKLSPITIPILALYEIIALKNGVWNFPGDSFISVINIFSQRLPLEEVVFFIILGSLGALSYYELYFKDNSYCSGKEI